MKLALLPAQYIASEGWLVITARSLIVMVELPDKSDETEAHVPLVSDAIEYVVATVGFTFTLIAGAVPVKNVPSERAPEIVPAPVTDKLKVADDPLQIAVVPLNVPVGRELTVIVAVPL